MLDIIVQYVLETVLLITLLFAYAIAVGSVLPRLLLKIKYVPGAPSDRGLRKYVFPEGRGITYETHPSVRKYVKLYALFVKDGMKYIKCKLADGVGYFSYSAVVFDNHNRMIDVVRVSDTALADGTSRSVTLPKEASYVAFVLYSVNGKKILAEEPFGYDEVPKRIFAVTVTVLSIVTAFIMRSAAMKILGIINEYAEIVDVDISVLLTLVVGAFAGLLSSRMAIRKNWKRMVG